MTTSADSTLEVAVHFEHESLRIDETRLRKRILAALGDHGIRNADVAIILTERQRVLALNRTFLNHDYPTDVLSFPGEAPPVEGTADGEVYVDLDTASERCIEFDASFEDEASRYALHGLLHLLGYRDDTDDGRREMRRLEDKYLAN